MPGEPPQDESGRLGYCPQDECDMLGEYPQEESKIRIETEKLALGTGSNRVPVYYPNQALLLGIPKCNRSN